MSPDYSANPSSHTPQLAGSAGLSSLPATALTPAAATSTVVPTTVAPTLTVVTTTVTAASATATTEQALQTTTGNRQSKRNTINCISFMWDVDRFNSQKQRAQLCGLGSCGILVANGGIDPRN